MVPTLFFYQLGLVALVWFFLMLSWLWPNDSAAHRQPIAPSKPSRCQRSSAPKPFASLTHKPPERCVNKRPWKPLQRLLYGLILCPRPIGVRVPWTPPRTFVPTRIVPIAVGWGWATCGRMVIPMGAMAPVSLPWLPRLFYRSERG